MSYKALPDGLYIKDSSIAGQGVFTKVDIASGINLGRTHLIIDDVIHRTPLGGFINHCATPNCELIDDEENMDYKRVKTLQKIQEGDELTLKYSLYKMD